MAVAAGQFRVAQGQPVKELAGSGCRRGGEEAAAGMGAGRRRLNPRS
jgi:hypothetical protein